MTAAARLALLLQTPTPAALGPASRSGTLKTADLQSAVVTILGPANADSLAAQPVLALLLLWHDHLEAAHELAQGLATPDGSFIHAMVHRREPDPWNSKYWWRRVGPHPAFLALAERAGSSLATSTAPELADKLIPNGRWNPGAFVDVCDAALNQPVARDGCELLQQLQQLETACLLDHLTCQLR